MFGWLTGKRRWRTAALLVGLYALCLATPTAVLAFSHGAIPAHCLTQDDQVAAAVHVHHDGTTHQHPAGKHDDGDHSDRCCGLFSVSAIAPDLVVLPTPHHPAMQRSSLAADSLTGRGSDRIDRPPRSHPSL